MVLLDDKSVEFHLLYLRLCIAVQEKQLKICALAEKSKINTPFSKRGGIIDILGLFNNLSTSDQ